MEVACLPEWVEVLRLHSHPAASHHWRWELWYRLHHQHLGSVEDLGLLELEVSFLVLLQRSRCYQGFHRLLLLMPAGFILDQCPWAADRQFPSLSQEVHQVPRLRTLVGHP